MDELDLLKNWYEYNSAVRKKYLDALATIPFQETKTDRGASFPLFEIFEHVVDAYRYWIRYVREDRLREYRAHRIKGTLGSVDALRKEDESMTKETMAYLGSLTDEALGSAIKYSCPQDRKWETWGEETIPVRVMLWHLVEEELQHRGEMNALFWQIGVEPPVAGWDDWWADKPRSA